MDGLVYESHPRKVKRRVGAGIISNSRYCSMEKIPISPPKPLELVWALVKPNNPGKYKQIIVCSFYSPPNTRKSDELLEHMTCNLQQLLLKYPKAGIIIAGDRNSIPIEKLLTIDHSLKQIVTKSTRKNKCLDVILTNMYLYYNEPEIYPPVEPDKEGHPSDHLVPVSTPRTDVNEPKREYRTRSYRTFPDSGLRHFGKWICSESWTELKNIQSPSLAVSSFENLFSLKIQDSFPLKFSRAPLTDKPWISMELSQLSRKKRREYEKHGKSIKYTTLRKQFNKELKEAIKKYRDKQLESVRNSSVKSGYSILKKMGSKLGENITSDLNLPCHKGFSPSEVAEDIANHFSSISNKYKPFEWNDLSDEINKKIEDIKSEDIPQVTDFDVYKKILTAKKPKSSVPGDIPKRIIKEFSVEISNPLAIIFNKALTEGEYPQDWKTEYGTAIPKVPNPETLDDTRLLSLTKFTSKLFEAFLVQWILEIVGPDLDPSQFGGLKGNSITHL